MSENIEKEDKKQIAYVVTAGQYSDYGIVALFSTREKADNFVKEHNEGIHRGKPDNWLYDDASVEEWEMDIR